MLRRFDGMDHFSIRDESDDLLYNWGTDVLNTRQDYRFMGHGRVLGYCISFEYSNGTSRVRYHGALVNLEAGMCENRSNPNLGINERGIRLVEFGSR